MKKYIVEYRVIRQVVTEIEADSIALAEEKLYETEKDYIDEVVGVYEKSKTRVLRGEA